MALSSSGFTVTRDPAVRCEVIRLVAAATANLHPFCHFPVLPCHLHASMRILPDCWQRTLTFAHVSEFADGSHACMRFNVFYRDSSITKPQAPSGLWSLQAKKKKAQPSQVSRLVFPSHLLVLHVLSRSASACFPV